MRPAIKLAAVAVGAATGFTGGTVLGEALGPVDTAGSQAPASSSEPPPPAHDMHHAGHSEHGGAESPASNGLLVTEAGYTFQAQSTTLSGAAGDTFVFWIIGSDGIPVQSFETRHESELHLVIAGRDLVSYVHLHPGRSPDGTWLVQLPPLDPGFYRAFASFVPAGGPELTLGVDLLVPGGVLPFAPLPPASNLSLTDGYLVTLTGLPVAGGPAELAFDIQRDGSSVSDIEPYLGALGHLVALRVGDLAYTHVHPVDDVAAGRGSPIHFRFEAPSAGDYRLFLEFGHGGAIHTAAFTVHVAAPEEAG